jgi:valyl-tRNA synthetase
MSDTSRSLVDVTLWRPHCLRIPVRIHAHELADPEKGTGLAMVCIPFGDVTDVTWWRELTLPVRSIIQPNGTLGPAR